jgi:hypothetical protein
MGVMSALPLINLGNMCCCLWVIAGGVIAAYLLQQDQPEPIEAGDGALVGLLAGLFGTVVAVVLSIPVALVTAPFQREVFRRMRENPDVQMPPGFEDFLSGAAASVLGTLFFGMAMLVASVIFGTIGGLLGAAIFKKPAPPPLPGPPGTSL